MIPNSVNRELAKRNLDHVFLTASDLINYILNHMIDPPSTLRKFALDLQIAIVEMKKKQGDL